MGRFCPADGSFAGNCDTPRGRTRPWRGRQAHSRSPRLSTCPAPQPRPAQAARRSRATTPRNRMSRSQRQGQAQQVTQPRTAPASSAPPPTLVPALPGASWRRCVAAAERTGRPTAASQSRARATKVIEGMVLAGDEDTVKALAAGAADLTHPVGYELDVVKASRELGLLRSLLAPGGAGIRRGSPAISPPACWARWRRTWRKA